jgi:hypothetical protein
LEADLPGGETHLCGDVPCAHGRCPVEFDKQWKALVGRQRGPVGILALQGAFGRGSSAKPPWIEQYVDQARSASAGPQAPLWLIVEDAAAADLARGLSPAAIVVAQSKIDQSFEPRVVAFRAAAPSAAPRSDRE